MQFAELEFSVKYLRSSAVFGGRLKRPLPCRIRSAPRHERGRMPGETSEKLQIISHVEEQFLRFWLYLNACSAWMIYEIGIISKR